MLCVFAVLVWQALVLIRH